MSGADKRHVDGSSEDATSSSAAAAESSPNPMSGADNRHGNGSGEDATSSAAATGGSCDEVAKALCWTLSSPIRELDCRAECSVRSQDHLSLSIDRLTRELDQLLEDTPVPFLMQHAARISGVRKRVSSLNVLLRSIQRRLDNVDRLLSVSPLQHGKVASEGTTPQQPET